MNFLDMFTSQLGSGQIDALSQSLGADKAQTQSALGAFVPLMVSALARNASTPEGANALSNALDRDHDGGILSMLPSLLNNPALGKGDGILGHVLGGKRPVAESAVSQSSGLSMESTARLFTMAAPLVLGMIGAKKRQDGFGADILSSMLNGFSQNHENDQQQEQAGGGLLGTIGSMVTGNQGASSGMGGFITAILDRDHDGSAIDDVGGMIGSMFTGRK